jgi:hypothetical protein
MYHNYILIRADYEDTHEKLFYLVKDKKKLRLIHGLKGFIASDLHTSVSSKDVQSYIYFVFFKIEHSSY